MIARKPYWRVVTKVKGGAMTDTRTYYFADATAAKLVAEREPQSRVVTVTRGYFLDNGKFEVAS